MSAEKLDRTDQLTPGEADASPGGVADGAHEANEAPAPAAGEPAGGAAGEDAVGDSAAQPEQVLAADDQPPAGESAAAGEGDSEEEAAAEVESSAPVRPLEDLSGEEVEDDGEIETQWYILKVQVNREDSIRDALQRRVKIEGLDHFFADIVVPTEDIAEFTKTGKKRDHQTKALPRLHRRQHGNQRGDVGFWCARRPALATLLAPPVNRPPWTGARGGKNSSKTVSRTNEGEAPKLKTAISIQRRKTACAINDGNFESFEGDVDNIDR